MLRRLTHSLRAGRFVAGAAGDHGRADAPAQGPAKKPPARPIAKPPGQAANRQKPAQSRLPSRQADRQAAAGPTSPRTAARANPAERAAGRGRGGPADCRRVEHSREQCGDVGEAATARRRARAARFSWLGKLWPAVQPHLPANVTIPGRAERRIALRLAAVPAVARAGGPAAGVRRAMPTCSPRRPGPWRPFSWRSSNWSMPPG